MLVVYSPSFLYISYFWLIPESIKWLIVKGKITEAKKIINRIATVNKHQLSKNSLQIIENNHQLATDHKVVETNYMELLNSPALLLRVLNVTFCWMTNAFIYYGISITSVLIGGNKYTNFIYTSLIEIPGYLICYYLSNKIGRKWTLFSALITTGLCCTVAGLISGLPILNLILFLLGKCSITVSFTVLYVYATELFPTNLRHSLMGICSTFARFGSMAAPQTPLLMRYMNSLPALMFGGFATLSAILILHFPETLNVPLPDTLQEALDIGKKKKKKERNEHLNMTISTIQLSSNNDKEI